MKDNYKPKNIVKKMFAEFKNSGRIKKVLLAAKTLGIKIGK
jgi:hypothetical protein